MKGSLTVPRAGPEREALREKGQFWTPPWIAEAMVGYVLGGGAKSVFDPAVGAGAFFLAAQSLSKQRGKRIKLHGTEIDPKALQQARDAGLTPSDLENVEITDFVLSPPSKRWGALVANPPYIRHHRLPLHVKAKLRQFGASLIGQPLDGRAGLHIYFLLRALQMLDTKGRLAFIMSADTCEGIFAPVLWNWIAEHYLLDAVVTFSPEATPFHGVDTNPIILMIQNAEPKSQFLWVRCLRAGTEQLKRWTFSRFRRLTSEDLVVYTRKLSEGLKTGLSREPRRQRQNGPTLAAFAKVLRGIATGANDFFLLSKDQVSKLRIPNQYVIPVIAKTRDVEGNTISAKTIADLEERGKPTLLLSLNGQSCQTLPPTVCQYLQEGERRGLPSRPLIATRRPWYRMEVRKTPPILFAYLGRRNTRFVRNLAGVVPLTGFLCVYPHCEDKRFIGKLWRILQDPATLANLKVVGKSYGSGAIKVEPRALENLPLPLSVVEKAGLPVPQQSTQLVLFSAFGRRKARR